MGPEETDAGSEIIVRGVVPGRSRSIAWELDGFDGESGQTRVEADGGRALLLVGTGEGDAAALRRAGRAAGRQLVATAREGADPRQAEVDIASFPRRDRPDSIPDDGTAALIEGLVSGSYRFRATGDGFRSDTVRFRPTAGTPERDAGSWRRGELVAGAVSAARDLVNLPPSALTPEMFAARAAELLGGRGVVVRERREAELRADGFGGVLAIGSGSANSPVLLELAIGGGDPEIVFVGKGVTFDSGGLSLKAAAEMITMKLDMAGAAAIVGAFSILSEIAPGRSFRAVIPLVENMPGPAAVRPGDVVRLHDGSTLEILNSDFEGRVILADALARAAEMRPGAIIDLATLTAAAENALGRTMAALVARDDGLGDRIRAAGERSGDRVWPMPMLPELRPLIRSEIADHRNFPYEPRARVSTAALLLSEFVPDGIPWAHVDMSGPAWREATDAEGAAGGTGFGAALIAYLVAGAASA